MPLISATNSPQLCGEANGPILEAAFYIYKIFWLENTKIFLHRYLSDGSHGISVNIYGVRWEWTETKAKE